MKEEVIYARSSFINKTIPLLPAELEETPMEDMTFKTVMVKPSAAMVMSSSPVQNPCKQSRSKVQLALQRYLEMWRQVEFLESVD